jgi:SpoVK/Ycf46/Vps4 family AAA+-type ATPase
MEQEKSLPRETHEDENPRSGKRTKDEKSNSMPPNTTRKSWGQTEAVRKRLEEMNIQEKENKDWALLKDKFLPALATGNLNTIKLGLELVPEGILAQVLRKYDPYIQWTEKAKIETKDKIMGDILEGSCNQISEENIAIKLLHIINDLNKTANIPVEDIEIDILSRAKYNNKTDITETLSQSDGLKNNRLRTIVQSRNQTQELDLDFTKLPLSSIVDNSLCYRAEICARYSGIDIYLICVEAKLIQLEGNINSAHCEWNLHANWYNSPNQTEWLNLRKDLAR